MKGRGAGRVIVRAAALAAVLAVLFIPSRAPATVQEQRERLPPAATDCDDPVAGVWKSHKYDPRFGDWYIFTLNIERVEGDPERLTGNIQAHAWTGTPEEEEPPPCRPGLWHWTVRMTAEGRVTPEGQIEFWGTSWQPENAFCGRMIGQGEYNLDHFSGLIDPEIMEFQSVNNDGGRSVNDPTVFRRISCGTEPPNPHINPVPPPFFPDSGCSCL